MLKPMTKISRITAWTATIAVSGFLGLTAGEWGGGERATDAHAREAYAFGSIDTMTATSAIVVVATARTVREGRALGSDPASQLWMRDVEFAVDETLHGEPAESLVVEELAAGQGGPLRLNGQPWFSPGERHLLFLVPAMGAPGKYQVVNGQARYRVEGDALRAENHEGSHDPLQLRIRSKSLQEIREEVRVSSRRAAEGKTQPQRPAEAAPDKAY